MGISSIKLARVWSNFFSFLLLIFHWTREGQRLNQCYWENQRQRAGGREEAGSHAITVCMGSSHCKRSPDTARRFIQPSYLLCLHSTASSANLSNSLFHHTHWLSVIKITQPQHVSQCSGLQLRFIFRCWRSLRSKHWSAVRVSVYKYLSLTLQTGCSSELSSTGWRGEEWITKLCCDQTKSAVGE